MFSKSDERFDAEHKAMDKYKSSKMNAVRFVYSLHRLKKAVRENEGDISLCFHDDADGLCGALLLYVLLQKMDIPADPARFKTTTHVEMRNIESSDTDYELFVDIQPKTIKRMQFVIDHHRLIDENFKYRLPAMEFAEQTFILWPENELEDLMLPISSSLLCGYVLYVFERLKKLGIEDYVSFDKFLAEMDMSKLDGVKNIFDYTHDMLWGRDPLVRALVLIGLISDNLWLLSHKGGEYVADWLKHYDIDVNEFVKESMAVSLLLSEKESREIVVDMFMNMASRDSREDAFKSLAESLASIAPMSNSLYDFASLVVDQTARALMYMGESVEEEIHAIEDRIGKNQTTLDQYYKTMPPQMRSSRDLTVSLMDQANKKDAKWKRIEFFAKEIKRLENNLSIERRRLEILREKRDTIHSAELKGVVVFLPKQRCDQVKGILSSLLYYLGRKNIVIEEDENSAAWGSRGLSREQLFQELTSFELDIKKLDYHLAVAEGAEGLPPQIRRGLEGISASMITDTKYVGGGGGRGFVFGGIIEGTVPQLFAMFDPAELRSKVKELASHAELGPALKALSQKGLRVPISKGLRIKYKDSNWVEVIAKANGQGGDVVRNGINRLEMWFQGDMWEFNMY